MPLIAIIAAAALLLSACAETGQGSLFQNQKSSAVVHACGPYPGFASAVAEAEKGCADAYESAGWTRVEPTGGTHD
jgi:hypothetical protein